MRPPAHPPCPLNAHPRPSPRSISRPSGCRTAGPHAQGHEAVDRCSTSRWYGRRVPHDPLCDRERHRFSRQSGAKSHPEAVEVRRPPRLVADRDARSSAVLAERGQRRHRREHRIVGPPRKATRVAARSSPSATPSSLKSTALSRHSHHATSSRTKSILSVTPSSSRSVKHSASPQSIQISWTQSPPSSVNKPPIWPGVLAHDVLHEGLDRLGAVVRATTNRLRHDLQN